MGIGTAAFQKQNRPPGGDLRRSCCYYATKPNPRAVCAMTNVTAIAMDSGIRADSTVHLALLVSL